ncbi:MmgE/PrpD family protein [Thalassotalea sp. Y01]|uniref:MmgE/PrpD family protein n=1 Tax=Thalassotalea sp. Y01 TaxID=2729613 RepID=UPI00145CC50B|nr:MmgE/PrpD family protein [Thalassotalea sp. Y01]NMP16955.1 MmgE/PrpD family protein [Thalassotalea sp. Y01]
MKQSLTEQLIIDIWQISVTDADRQRATKHVVDYLACAAVGAKSAQGLVYAKLVEQAASGSISAVFNRCCDLQTALAFNAAIGNVMEMDDIHRSSILHPGPVVIPAALALAEQQQVSMQCFLDAVIKGYEVTIRMGQSIGRSHYKYFHNTSTCAALDAATAAAVILGLNAEQTVNAIGNAGSRTGGLWQMRHENVMSKQWHNSEAAKSGVNAAIMASYGLTGPKTILEGELGIFNALSDAANPQAFVAKHDNWLIYDVSFKPWPACRHAHPAIDAFNHALASAQQPVDVEDIDAVRVETYQDAKLFCDRLHIDSDVAAKFSIQHALAAIVVFGKPKLEHYSAKVYQRSDIGKLREKISVDVSPTIEADYPQHYGARCEITLKSGIQLSGYRQDTLGDPETPLSEQQFCDKAQMLFAAADIDQHRIEHIVAMQWQQHNDITALSKLLD